MDAMALRNELVKLSNNNYQIVKISFDKKDQYAGKIIQSLRQTFIFISSKIIGNTVHTCEHKMWQFSDFMFKILLNFVSDFSKFNFEVIIYRTRRIPVK